MAAGTPVITADVSALRERSAPTLGLEPGMYTLKHLKDLNERLHPKSQ